MWQFHICSRKSFHLERWRGEKWMPNKQFAVNDNFCSSYFFVCARVWVCRSWYGLVLVLVWSGWRKGGGVRVFGDTIGLRMSTGFMSFSRVENYAHFAITKQKWMSTRFSHSQHRRKVLVVEQTWSEAFNLTKYEYYGAGWVWWEEAKAAKTLASAMSRRIELKVWGVGTRPAMLFANSAKSSMMTVLMSLNWQCIFGLITQP